MKDSRIANKMWGYISILPFIMLLGYYIILIFNIRGANLSGVDLYSYFTEPFDRLNEFLTNWLQNGLSSSSGAFYDIYSFIANFFDKFNLSSGFEVFVLIGLWILIVQLVHFFFDILLFIPNYIISWFERKVK